MTDREKLIEMLKTIYKEYSVSPSDDLIASYFISHGVVVLPCRCWDCAHRGTDDCPMHIVGAEADEKELVKFDNDYCSYGERE